jgi:hypothetical protein
MIMFYCEKCGRPFIMRQYLTDHICDGETNMEIALEKESFTAEELTKKELVARAKELNIKGADRMTKDEVIEAINEAEFSNA